MTKALVQIDGQYWRRLDIFFNVLRSDEFGRHFAVDNSNEFPWKKNTLYWRQTITWTKADSVHWHIMSKWAVMS